jgi:UDPglucose 6-dehydrogenase
MEAAVRHYAEQSGDRIAVLGAAYKPNTPVIEESQGVMLAGILAKTGYQVTLSDPQALPHAQAVLSDSVNYTESAEDAVRNSDVIIVTTAWQQFAQVPVSAFRGNGKIKSVIDPWSLLNQAAEMRDLNYVKLGGLQSLPARLVQ